MIKALISDFSRVLLFPKDESYLGSLNGFYREHKASEGFVFFDHFYLNTELLEYYQSLKGRVELYILTSEDIQTDPALEPFLAPVFEGIFSGADLGASKKQPQIYTTIAGRIGSGENQMLFIDDSAENIQAANIAGVSTIAYVSNQETIRLIKERLSHD